MRRNLISLFILLAVSVQATDVGHCDEQTDDSPSVETIRQWAIDLDSDSFRVRSQATRDLIEAGRLAAVSVGLAIERGGPEVRERRFLILRRLVVLGDMASSAEAERVLVGLSRNKTAQIASRAAEIVADIDRERLHLTILKI